jgi:DNA ligase-1
MAHIFQTLFERTDKNKIKEWNIRVEDYYDYSLIVCSYGFTDGKKTESKTKVEQGKNIGKKNETNHFEQAVKDAQSKWDKKMKEGYSPYLNNTDENDEKDVEENDEVIFPMLAQEYKKQIKKIKFPCFIQPKLDGYRMIYNPKTKKCTTRTGKEYGILYDTELYKELREMNVCLDGELYIHDKSVSFESYGILRKTKNLTETEKKLINKIEYHVYDIVDDKKTYKSRKRIIQEFDEMKLINVVPTFLCKSFDDIEKYHLNFVEDGYEGSMIRNSEGMYRKKHRSCDLLKKKDFDDDEFRIVDYTYEKDTKGNDENLIVWICETKDKKKFNVQSKGTREERQEIFKNAEEYIGQKLSVQYFGLTNDGIPRFPKTLRNGLDSIRNEKE